MKVTRFERDSGREKQNGRLQTNLNDGRDTGSCPVLSQRGQRQLGLRLSEDLFALILFGRESGIKNDEVSRHKRRGFASRNDLVGKGDININNSIPQTILRWEGC